MRPNYALKGTLRTLREFPGYDVGAGPLNAALGPGMNVPRVLIVGVLATLFLVAATFVKRWLLRLRDDQYALSDLERSGADMSKPQSMAFHLHFPSRDAAVEAESSVRAAGYSVQIGGGDSVPFVILCAVKEVVPTLAQLSAVRSELGDLGRKYGGRLDCWFVNSHGTVA